VTSEFKLTEEELGQTGKFVSATSADPFYLLVISETDGSYAKMMSEALPGGKDSFCIRQGIEISLFLLTVIDSGLTEVLRFQTDLRQELLMQEVKFCFHACYPVISGTVHPEVFGKEITLALSVIESAAAGQIYITGNNSSDEEISFPVFEQTRYVRHGAFFYKARFQPLEIFEAVVGKKTKPVSPLGCKKKNEKMNRTLGLVSICVLVLVIFSMVVSINMFVAGEKRDAQKKAEERALQDKIATQVEPEQQAKAVDAEPAVVFFRGLYWATIFLDGEMLTTAPVEGKEDLKKSLTNIEPGNHVVHVDGGPVVRYYSEIDVKPGENIIGLKFFESTLANLEAEWEFDAEDEDGLKVSKSFFYVVYDNKTKVKNGISAAMRIEILPFDEDEKKKNEGKPVVATPDPKKQKNFYLLCYLSLNGEKKLNKKMVIPVNADIGPEYDMTPVRVYEDDSHYFYITYKTEFNKIKFVLGGAFK
jgi:hypothetical protein